MATSHVISGLLTKKAELLGEIERAEERLSVLRQSLEHVDGTLAVFGHDDAKPIRPIRRAAPTIFQQGEVTRLVLDLLRERGPQTNGQLRDAIAAKKGLDLTDSRLRHDVHCKVRKVLDRSALRGLLTQDGKCWRLTF